MSAVERCIACGGEVMATLHEHAVDYISGQNFRIVRCQRCALGQTNPVIGDDAIAAYYPRRYRGERQRLTASWRTRRRASQIERSTLSRSGRVLDIGCGKGDFAEEMKRRGWDVVATEIDEATVARLRESDIRTMTPQVAQHELAPEIFDAITCWHVLEHVTDPIDLARWACGLLREHGVFVITVPDAASWQASISGPDWMHWDVPRHRWHFTADSLDKLLGQCGLQVVQIRRGAIEYDWFGVIQSALNKVCSKPNVLFDLLSGSGAKASAKDVAISYALGPMIGAASFPVIAGLAALGRGATLTAICTRRA